ncbi:MipA/OmpV family protein [Sphingomonas sp. NCPPB 2930]
MKRVLLGLMVAAMSLSTSGVVQAQAVESVLSGLAIGVDQGSAQNPYRGADADRQLQAIVSFRSRNLRLAPDSIDYRALDTETADLWLRARYRDDGYDLGDGVGAVSAHSHGKGLWIGARSIVTTPWTDLQTTFMAGASSEAKGDTLSFRLTRKFVYGSITMAPRASVTRLSANYVDHFYGVDSVTRNAPGFSGSPAWSRELGAQVAWKLDEHQVISLDIMTTHLGGAITSSPLVVKVQ